MKILLYKLNFHLSALSSKDFKIFMTNIKGTSRYHIRMAAKDKTPAKMPAKKKTYRKPTADKIADKDLAGVTGGSSSPQERMCSSGSFAKGMCGEGSRVQPAPMPRCRPGQGTVP
jgi:hypothetical protein